MLCFRSLLFSILTAFLLVSSTPFSFSIAESHSPALHSIHTSGKNGVDFSWGKKEKFLDEDSNELELNSTLVLAAERTYRKDPLNDFKKYTGGWNLGDHHYWASVGFTAVPLFCLAAAWFVVFGLCLLLVCLCHCCCRKQSYGYSRTAYALSLIFLALFTVATIIGCVVLYTGQGKFHSSIINTLEYVEDQADTTAENLQNVSDYLSAAKQIAVDQVLLPSNVQSDIDQIQNKISSSASTLTNKTEDNSEDIKNVIRICESGSYCSLCCYASLNRSWIRLVIVGWILVTGTFILCGIFLLLHNVTADTCVAMEQWVQNPTAHTALDEILPCVDNATAQETLLKSKEVTSQLVEVTNQVITNVSNINFSPNFKPMYYNQSGPLLPTLCSPFNFDSTDRVCTPGQVDLNNATQVWSNYVCQVSPDGICVTTGRLTPALYSQMASTVNYSKWIYVGLVMVAIASMLSLLFFVIYGRERRHRMYTKEHMPEAAEGLEGDKHT
ncbi:hypothetical protein Adt_40019 [Abeliophyllum distichum]|uniref:Transmembrane protein n=1 Tax=Abeliophyllum distichum TaxID=126358 RepID=A0ABD1Q6R0_9LAMI